MTKGQAFLEFSFDWAVRVAKVSVLHSAVQQFKQYKQYRYMVVVAQLVERQVVILDVAGSSPVDHPKLDVSDPLRRVVFVGYSVNSFYALLAQLAEHRTLNPQVLGSIPRERTTFRKWRASALLFCFVSPEHCGNALAQCTRMPATQRRPGTDGSSISVRTGSGLDTAPVLTSGSGRTKI
jgi:hypothetical protein